jgi:hypothetical protein
VFNGRNLLKPVIILIFFVSSCTLHRSEPQRGVVNLEVGLDYQLEGVNPVVGQEFYIVDTDLNQIIGGSKEDSQKEATKRLWVLTTFVDGSWGSAAEKQRADLTRSISAHTAAKGKTDLKGDVTFAPIAPGVYYVVGWSTTRDDQLVIWNYRVEVRSGLQKVSLSNLDAAAVAKWLPWPPPPK